MFFSQKAFAALMALAYIGCVLCHPAVASYQVFESVKAVPSGWRVQSNLDVNRTSPMQIRMHLKQQNVAEFEQSVYDMSTPGHSTYGAHMTQNAINDFLQPAEETVKLVMTWLAAAGLQSNSWLEQDWMHINATVSDVESLLDARYYYFQNAEINTTVLRTLKYGLPISLHEHIDMVHPTSYFPGRTLIKPVISDHKESLEASRRRHLQYARRFPGGLDVASCNITVTPDCVKALYGFKDFHPSPTNGNKFAVAGYLQEYVQDNDLEAFLNIYDVEANTTGYEFISVNGGLNTQYWGKDTVESAIDLQYGISLNYPTPVSYYQTAGSPPINYDVDTTTDNSEPYLEWLTYMLALNDSMLPQVVSTSYADDEQTVPEAYARTVCNLFAQLAARGVSALFATGDAGPGGACISNDGTNTTRFIPTFPASCPFVTAVGATQHVEPEIGVSFSGGGFSNYFSRPAYQEAAVSSYLRKHGDTWAPYFNSSGRAYPDVSAQGTNVSIIYWGGHRYEAGTSCSTPIFASVISLLNSERLSKGKRPLGFLNPWLYSEAAGGLQDIISGRSEGCSGWTTTPGAVIDGAGWDAVVGWDPATGLGTPKFKELLDYI
ncbi:hypothetical protein BP5796_05026 [Coleophoma crateriformis]|uniref:tripeptidyl-peptidase II n=1 Tax=Coleophoma crateriformis TaxID=565419 RepID=A0A3D8S230_9HELO|nr:hypothetical protein BP5796_05026 [Coleophoma crateriformis]